MGLPLAREFCRGGGKVIGFDVNPQTVAAVNRGRSPIKHLGHKTIGQMVRSGQFSATEDMTRLSEPDAILICVPTPLTKNREPDLQYVESTCRVIAKHLRKGQLVVLESTTYPGTTREVMLPMLEESGLKVEKDFFLAYSPEREDPGNKDFQTATIPKVIGGYGKESLRRALETYGQLSGYS